MNVEEYYQTLIDRIKEEIHEADDEGTMLVSKHQGFTAVGLEILQELGQASDFDLVYFEKKIGRGIARSDGFYYAEHDGRLELIATVCDGAESLESVPGAELDKAARGALHYFQSCARQDLYKPMEQSSDEFHMTKSICGIHKDITALRIIVLTDGIAKRLPQEVTVEGIQITVDVWDVERLHRAQLSGHTFESIVINLSDRQVGYLTADTHAEDHQCYLTILPGILLHDLYHEHGPRLLELNVRSFLQARGKVNRGLRDTLNNDPNHFLAYNNGISVTAEDIELDPVSQTIRTITGMQIVNGGQTTASIHRAKDRDGADISNVWVQAKITVHKGESTDPADLVSAISRYSNTQNKVQEMDFSSNHPYHVKLQQLSETIWTPGERSKWFYERAKGQWEVARLREGTTGALQRKFDDTKPKKQKLDKALIAKAINCWDQHPDIVSQGAQKSFVHLMENVSKAGESWEPDKRYFQQTVAKVILYKKTYEIVRKQQFEGYWANTVAYTMALLAHRTAGRLDLMKIWEDQGITPSLEETLRNWTRLVHEGFTAYAGERNVTQVCKKRVCWVHIQTHVDCSFAENLQDELGNGMPLPNVGSTKKKSLTEEEARRQYKVMSHTPQDFFSMQQWGNDTGHITGRASDFLITLQGYANSKWTKIPSVKQTKWAVELIELWESHRNTDA